MSDKRRIAVHAHPTLVDAARLDGLVIVVDVLRATTTMVYALAAGCRAIIPVAEIDAARQLYADYARGLALLTGERDGKQVPGFDMGNSPEEFTTERCRNRVVICTTTNGTRAILHARHAPRVLIGAFVNFSAVCEEARATDMPIHVLCSGSRGTLSLEDMMFAGAVVEFFADRGPVELNDGARIAWDTYDHHGQVLVSALELSDAGQLLLSLGMDADLKAAAAVDRFGLVPSLRREPFAIVTRNLHLASKHFRGDSGLME